MEIISANKLGQLAIENKKQFEQLLPELVKRLILVSNHDVRYLRTPSRDDVWAPGFDGIVETENNSRFVCAGRSVWEFGTSSDSLEKINCDYEKRTKDSLGVVPSETSFYLVMPKIWAYKKKSLTEWENERKEWKKVSVYDASILCDWINSEPTVCAWLLEQIDSDGNLDFCTVHKAWERFSNLTNPKFCTKMFLTGREDQISSFFRNCSNRIIRVKAQSLVDSRGFVLASLLSNRELCEKTIVINNEKTYRVISSMVKDKLIFLNFPFDGEVDDNNNTIIPLNCEATNEADVEVIPLTKTEYMAALKEMTNSDYEPHDLFAFSHGNLRALIRRIPGYIIESRPDWSKIPDVSLLIPLVFLRVVDIDCDKELVEKLSGKPYLTVLDKYNELLSLEDSPIKKVNRKYVIVNYEEAWDVLNLSVADYHYSLLEDAIHFLFEEIVRNGFLHSQKGRYYSRNPLFYNLFLNLIYFQEEGSQNLEINQTVRKILARTEEPRLANIIIENLSLLAEASPKEVMDFISSDMAKENSLIICLFGNNEYDHSYCQVLYALEELARNSETIVEACRIMFLLHEKAYSYSINNVPEDSLLNALCLINNEGTATLAQKKAILIKLMKKNGRIAADIVLKAAFKDSYYRGVRIGEKPLRGEKISAKQFFDAVEIIVLNAFDVAIEQHDAKIIKSIFENYHKVRLEVFYSMLSRFTKSDFDENELFELNYWLRERRYHIRKYRWTEDKEYSVVMTKWIAASTNSNPIKANGWVFRNYYECPAYELTDEDYLDRGNKTKSYRDKVFAKLVGRVGERKALSVIQYMEDCSNWGYYIAEKVSDDLFFSIAKETFSAGKIMIVAGMIDASKESQGISFLNSLQKDERLQIIPLLSNEKLVLTVPCEEEKRAFWLSHSMREWDESSYDEYLKYNPSGLLPYFYFECEKEISNCLEKVEETFSVIVEKNIKLPRRFVDDVERIITCVDEKNYSDNWARLVLKMYLLENVNVMPECVKKYAFFNSAEISSLFENETVARRFWGAYSLPKQAYGDYESFCHFFDCFLDGQENKDEALYRVGDILGRTEKDSDGWFPHLFTRKYLEKIDSKEVDVEVYVSRNNSFMNFRAISDGSEQRRKSNAYKVKAEEIEAEYPHAAYILKCFSDEYANNAKNDYEDSETNII